MLTRVKHLGIEVDSWKDKHNVSNNKVRELERQLEIRKKNEQLLNEHVQQLRDSINTNNTKLSFGTQTEDVVAEHHKILIETNFNNEAMIVN